MKATESAFDVGKRLDFFLSHAERLRDLHNKGAFLSEIEMERISAADEIKRLRDALQFTRDWLSPVAAQHKGERTIFHDICDRVEEALNNGR